MGLGPFLSFFIFFLLSPSPPVSWHIEVGLLFYFIFSSSLPLMECLDDRLAIKTNGKA